jgi:acetolactate synthase-1/2/3 large subunit
MIKLSDYVVEFISAQGVKHVFMLPGGGAMHLNDSLGQCTQLEYVCNLHEQASAIAAECYAKVTGNLGAAMVTTGPGGTNAVTGVAGAWLESTPCLFVSGQVKRADLKGDLGIRQHGVQEVDIVSIVGPITKYAVLVTDPSTIRYHLEKAVHFARTGRQGPVWIDIPLDVQAAQIEPTQLRRFDPTEEGLGWTPTTLTKQVSEAIELLNRASRPVLLAGCGIRHARSSPEFRRVVERLQIPVLLTWLAMDLLDENHPLYAGRPGPVAPRGANFTLQNSDLLLAVGARLDLVITAYAPQNLARGAKKIMVDIDQAEIRKLGSLIHLPIHADAGAFLAELLHQSDGLRHRERGVWLERCREWKRKYPVVLSEHRVPEGRVSIYHLAEILANEADSGDLIVSGSSGSGIEIFLHAWKVKQGQRVLLTSALGAMGFGIPASIGACLAGGRARTVCVDGDGGIHLNIQELATIAHLQLPVKLFVLNNDGFASIRASQAHWFQGRLTAADATSGLTLPDTCRIAEAYGLAHDRIGSQQDLRAGIRRVLDRPGPVVCDVLVLPDEPRIPRVASMQRPDGSMVSRPLEDLFPFLSREEFRANMIVPPLDE